jgi:AcrR family transcriptional regulator
MKKKKRENPNNTASKLIEVASDLFSRKGFKGTSIREIAREADMTSSNLYHHFGTKEKLLFSIEKATIKPILEELRKIAALEMPPLDHLVLLLRTHLTYMGTHLEKSKILFANQEISVPGRKEYKEEAQKEIFTIYRTVIERQLENVGHHGNSSILTLSTFGVMNWFLFWYKEDGRLPMQAVIEYVVDFILYGINGSRFSLQPSATQPKLPK